MNGQSDWPRGIRRAAGAAVAAALLAAALSAAVGGPVGEQVVHGTARIARDGSLTTIEAGHDAIIRYESFDIARHETARFIQPSAAARVLNRIRGAAPTHIDGTLTANGQVYFVNPAGVYFGREAVVDVAAIYAAAGRLSDADFLAGVNRFTDLAGPVVNYGTIRGGTVALVGQRVANYGTIVAERGTVAMVAGDEVLLGPLDGGIMVKVEGGARADGPAVENAGTVDAAGGEALLGCGDMYSLAIRNSGTVKARRIVVESGAGGRVEVGGSLDASDLEGVGGSIRVAGREVVLLGAVLDVSGAVGPGTVAVEASRLDLRATAGDDHIGLLGDAASELTLSLNDVNYTLSRVDELIVRAGAGDDTLTVDCSAGNPVPLGGLVCHGEGQATALGDALAVLGGPGVSTATYAPSLGVPDSGSLTLAGRPIRFTGLEPTTISGLPNATLVTGGAADVLSITDTTASGSNALLISGTSDATAFESVTVYDATNVIIDAATNHVGTAQDSITLNNAVPPTGIATLTINTGDGNDTLDVLAASVPTITFNAAAGDDTFNVSADAPANTGTVDGIVGALTLNGGGGLDTLNVSDAGDATGDTGTLSATQITGLGNAVAITHDAEALTLDLGDGSDTLSVTGTAGATTVIRGNGGNDTFSVQAVADGVALTIAGGAGNDQLSVISDLGSGTALTSVDFSAETLASAAIATTGGQAFTGDAITLSGAAYQSTSGPIALTGPVTFDGAGQAVDAGTGALLASTTLTKTSTGALNLGGDAGIDLGGTVDVQDGSLVIEDSLNAAGDLQASAGITLQGAATLDGGASQTVQAGGALDIQSTLTKNAPGDLTLSAGGAVTQGGALSAATLLLLGSGPWTLTQSNDVDTLAANVSGALSYTDANALTVGSVGGTDGINTGGNALTLATGDQLTLAQGLSAAGQRVTLDPAVNGVSQAGGVVSAGELLLTGAGTFTLTQANAVGTLAGSVNGALSYTDTDALIVGSVGGTNGLTTGGNPLTLGTGGQLTLSQSVTAAGNMVRLNVAAGGVNQAGGALTADELLLTGVGDFTLNQANAVGTLAAYIHGNLQYTAADAVALDRLGGISAAAAILTGDSDADGTPDANGGNVTVSAGGTITVARDILTTLGAAADGIVTPTGNVVIHGGADLIEGDGEIAINGGGGTVTISSPLQATLLQGNEDIIIQAAVTTPVGESLQVFADLDADGSGGVWVEQAGQIVSDGTLLIEGSDLIATPGALDSVVIDADGADAQVQASGTLTIQPRTGAPVPAGADMRILGLVRTTGAQAISIDAADRIELAHSLVTVGGPISLLDPLLLTGAASLSTGGGGGDIVVPSAQPDAAGSNRTLAIDAGTGSVDLQGAVGSAGTELLSLAIGGGTVTFRGDVFAGAQDYTGASAAVIDGAITFDADHTGGGITFAGVPITRTAPTDSLTLRAQGGDTITLGRVGAGAAPLASVAATAGTIALNGGSVTTTGTQTYTGSARLGADTTLTGTLVTFDGTLRGAAAGQQSLAVAGDAVLGGAVGATPLQFLTVSGTSAINGGSVATTGIQTYSGAATLGADTALSGSTVTFGSTLDAAGAGVQSLAINGSGVFRGVVGATALEFLTVSGTSAINGGSVATTGVQTYSGTATLGANTTLSGSTVTFAGALNAATAGGQGLAITGDAAFGGAVGATRLGFLTVSGTSALNGGQVRTTGVQTYGGAARLGADATLTGSTVTFGGALRAATSGQQGLAVTGNAAFNGAVGATALEFLTVSGRSAINGGSVVTAGIQAYAGAVALGANTTLTAGSDVTFGSTIDADAAPSDLIVDAGGSKITFGGDVGGGIPLASLQALTTGDIEFRSSVVTQGGDIRLGSDLPAGFVPEVAKIYVRSGDLSFETNGGDFIMGRHQKLTVVSGDLVIDAAPGGAASVGDLSVDGSVSILAGTIRLLLRPKAFILLPDEVRRGEDNGLDFVGTRGIVLSGSVVTDGTGPSPAFGALDPDDITGAGDFQRVALGLAPTLVGEMTGTVLDAAAEGVTVVDFGTVLASAVPREPEEEAVTEEVQLTPALRELLQELGIFARNLRTGESRLYNDLIAKAQQDRRPEDYQVAAARLPGSLAEQAVATYRGIFWKDDEPQASRLRGLLQRAFDECAERGERPDGVAFRRFLETTPAHAEALEVLNDLRRLLDQIGLLGLTDMELRIAERILVRDLVARGLGPQQLIAAIKGPR